jgi:hypothetical protein
MLLLALQPYTTSNSAMTGATPLTPMNGALTGACRSDALFYYDMYGPPMAGAENVEDVQDYFWPEMWSWRPMTWLDKIDC